MNNRSAKKNWEIELSHDSSIRYFRVHNRSDIALRFSYSSKLVIKYGVKKNILQYCARKFGRSLNTLYSM